MAVPTISAVSPAVGATGGGNLVEITGTGFQLWTIPPPSGAPAGPLKPTVEVLFGGELSPRVIVASATRLFAIAPRTPLASIKPAYGEGSVDLVVRNIDAAGAVIAGETVTRPAGYAYRRVQLAVESDLSRLCRALLHDMRAKTIANVVFSEYTDYDPETGDGLNTVAMADVPGIALIGPELVENRRLTTNERRWRPTSVAFERELRRAPFTVDLVFTVVGVAELHAQVLNLMAVMSGYFEQTKRVSMARDPADASKGRVAYDLDVLRPDGSMRLDGVPSASNVRSFTGRIALRGFDVEDLAGFPGHQVISRTAQVDEANVLVEQFVSQEEP